METSAQKSVRLVHALEDLVAQEAAALQSQDFTQVLAIQGRAAPVVQLLASLADDVPAGMRPRIKALLEQRQRSDAWLANEIEAVRVKLRETTETQRRLVRLAPAYRTVALGANRLSAVG